MNKPSHNDVLRIVGEPVAYLGVPRAFAVYTEAQLLAMYAAGAEDMRERAAKACDDQAKEPECPERADYCAVAIRALPINT